MEEPIKIIENETVNENAENVSEVNNSADDEQVAQTSEQNQGEKFKINFLKWSEKIFLAFFKSFLHIQILFFSFLHYC